MAATRIASPALRTAKPLGVPISLTIDRREDPEQELELTGHDALAGTGGSSMFYGQLYGTSQVRSDLDRKGV
ncbi:MAG TPA: hypothetical protein VNH82_11210 [Candidatus Dormibacteraeota bacterium]|nr:hypothetical protein [Candidatus Dormibacteraeota bacterium]